MSTVTYLPPSFSSVTVIVLGMNANSTPGSGACASADRAEAMSAVEVSVPKMVLRIIMLLGLK
jgi:hypothetical protein